MGKNWDCNRKFKEWILNNGYANEDELDEIEEQAKKLIRNQRNDAWKAYHEAILKEQQEALTLIEAAVQESRFKEELRQVIDEVQREFVPLHRYNTTAVRKTLRTLRSENIPAKKALADWLQKTPKSITTDLAHTFTVSRPNPR